MGLACNRPSRRFRRARGRGPPLGGRNWTNNLEDDANETQDSPFDGRPITPAGPQSSFRTHLWLSWHQHKSNQLARRFCSAAPDTLLQQQAPPIHKTTKVNGLHQWMGFRAWWLSVALAWCSRSCAKSAHIRCAALPRRMTPLRLPAAGLSLDHHEHPRKLTKPPLWILLRRACRPAMRQDLVSSFND